MQAAEKRQLDSIKSLYASAFKLKLKLQELMFKLETQGERCDWPNYLNTLGLCASELNEIRKFVESERFPQADSLVLTPLLLSPDPDPILGKATEERLSVFNHDSVPQYLRTRLDPHIEAQRAIQLKRGSAIPTEQTNKLVNVLNRVLDSSLKEVAFLKQELEGDLADRQNKSQGNKDDLLTLVSAITTGKGLKNPSTSTMK